MTLTVPGNPETPGVVPPVIENLVTVPAGIAEVSVQVIEPSAVFVTEVVPKVPVASSYP